MILYMLTRFAGFFIATLITVLAYRRAYLMSRSVSNELMEAYNLSSTRLLMYPVAQITVYAPIFSLFPYLYIHRT